MGFDEQDIIQALKITGNHQESAVCISRSYVFVDTSVSLL